MNNKKSIANNKRISQFYFPNLSDWEILSAVKYCNKVIEKKTAEYKEEYFNMCLFFFNGNEEIMLKSINEVKSLYIEEYSNRHIN